MSDNTVTGKQLFSSPLSGYDVDDTLVINEESFVTFTIKRYDLSVFKGSGALSDRKVLERTRNFDYVLL